MEKRKVITYQDHYPELSATETKPDYITNKTANKMSLLLSLGYEAKRVGKRIRLIDKRGNVLTTGYPSTIYPWIHERHDLDVSL